MIMDYEYFRTAAAIIGCAALSYFDIFNKKNVPDRLLQAFLAVSLLFALASFQGASLLFALGIPAILGFGGFIAYKAGHVGGADVYAIVSVAILLPFQPPLMQTSGSMQLPGLPFIFPILYYSILLFCIHVISANAGKALSSLASGKLKPEPFRLLQAALLFFAYLAFVFVSGGIVSLPYLLSISAIFISGIFFTLFGNFLKREAISFLPAGKLSEEDVLATEFMGRETVRKFSLPKLISAHELARLKKLPIKKYAVYTGMPMFLPFLLLGLLLALYFGNAFLVPF